MATRRPSRGHLDLSKQDAAFRPATIEQKVKQWHGHGGGILETSSPPPTHQKKAAASPKVKSPSPASSPQAYQSKKFTVVKDLKTGHHLIVKDAKTGQHAILQTRSVSKAVAAKDKSPADKPSPARERQERMNANVTHEVKVATSPKKRVVSDSHWMKDRRVSQSKEKKAATAEAPRFVVAQKSTPNFRARPSNSREVPAMAWTAKRPMKEKSIWTKWDPTKDPVYQTTIARERSRSRSRERSKDATPTQKANTPRRQHQPHLSNNKRRTSSSTQTSDDTTTAPTTISLATPAPEDSISQCAPRTAPDPPPKLPPTQASRKISGPAPLFSRNGLVARDRDKPLPPITKPGDRIDNWLGAQPDPFKDDSASSATKSKMEKSSPTQVPEPLRPRKRDEEPQEKSQFTIKRKPLGQSNENRQFSFEKGDDCPVTNVETHKESPREKENSAQPSKPFWNQDRLRVPSDESQGSVENEGPSGIGLGIGLGTNNGRRGFPTTGKPLSTIASVVTETTKLSSREESSNVALSCAESVVSSSTIRAGTRKSSGLKRRLTKHDDLMTVLSAKGATASLISARTFRAQREKLSRISAEGAMKGLAEEEKTYQAELQTLVDGVIPALLSSVLSRGSSSDRRNLFDQDGNREKVTQPIVDMGVALERLKTQHRRIPQTDPAALLIWAQTAAKVYEDYLKAWRLGFHDVVVNVPENDKSEWHQGMDRNEGGELLNSKGERLDVAFLLKRPLVRVKGLTKTFWAINYCLPSSDAENVAERYHNLTEAARKKSNDELTRLEDEAASSIDATRARDPKSLAPLAGVRIDQTRSVRARDYFEMSLGHSSGQQLDCAIEVFIRDNEANPNKGGDVLICEVSDTGRWLLFPPFVQDMVSARKGKTELDLLLMIRGISSDGSEWSELLKLHSDSPDAVLEWADMLAEGPVPPSPTLTAFTNTPALDAVPTLEDLVPKPLSPRPKSLAASPQPSSPAFTSERPAVAFKSRTPSPKEIEIPIGEQARKTSKRWTLNPNGVAADLLGQVTPGILKRVSGSHPPLSLETRRSSMPPKSAVNAVRIDRSSVMKDLPLRPSTRANSETPRPAPQLPHLDFSRHTRHESLDRPIPIRRPSLTDSKVTIDSISTAQSSRNAFSVWMPSASDGFSDYDDVSDEEDDEIRSKPLPKRPGMHKHDSSMTSASELSIPKARRKQSPPSTPPGKLVRSNGTSRLSDGDIKTPLSAPGKLQKIKDVFKPGHKTEVKKAAETPTKPKNSFFTAPNFLKRDRRPSSPLKRQYTAPEDASESDEGLCSDTDFSDSDTDSLSSYSLEEEEKYDAFQVEPLPSLAMPLFPRKTPPQSIASMTGPSLDPSNSASQGPYRSVPQQDTVDCKKTVAGLFSWSNRGAWDALYPQEITVVVSPGLIEAFTMADVQSVPSKTPAGFETSPSRFGIKPLIALELTPLVPLRRGTALDISIRSPPTANSQISTSSNVMFRSRSPEECEVLYNLMNQARINNATYIALQNARPADGAVGTWAAQMDRRNALRSGSGTSWFSLGSRRGSTYRSNNIRQPGGRRAASTAASESSIGTMTSAFSALRRMSGFGTRDASTTGSGSSGFATPPGDFGTGNPAALGGLGRETKIRLYKREGAKGKWRDLGSARLSILLPETLNTAGKRVLVSGATRGETLLDATLGESSFERVARTGIAVSVWTDNAEVGRAAVTGGVGAGRMEMFMIQMKSEREAAYTFGLVGKLRY